MPMQTLQADSQRHLNLNDGISIAATANLKICGTVVGRFRPYNHRFGTSYATAVRSDVWPYSEAVGAERKSAPIHPQVNLMNIYF